MCPYFVDSAGLEVVASVLICFPTASHHSWLNRVKVFFFFLAMTSCSLDWHSTRYTSEDSLERLSLPPASTLQGLRLQVCTPISGLIKISGSIFVNFFSCLKFLCKNSIGHQLSVLCLSWGCHPVLLLSYWHRERALLWGLHRVPLGSLTGVGVKPEANSTRLALVALSSAGGACGSWPSATNQLPKLGVGDEASSQGLQLGL